jgi:endonuclease G
MMRPILLLASFGMILAAGALAAPAAAINTPPAAKPTLTYKACQTRYAVTGLPKMKSDGSADGPFALCRKGYALAFNPNTRVPDWVIERLPLDWLSGEAQRKDNFHADTDVDTAMKDEGKGPQTTDYKKSGYDQGHQAPAGDFKSDNDMMDQSFLLTNMAPQIGIGFNRNIWKQLETDVRGWILCGGRKELYVVTGPVYNDDNGKWLKNRVRVPDAFFKVIYDAENKRALGMLLPNKKLNTADLPNYAVPISDIEEKTGIVFFPTLTKRQQNLLKNSTATLWGDDDTCTKDASE